MRGNYNILIYSCDSMHILCCDGKVHKKKEVSLLRMENTENANPLMEKMLHNSVEMINALC